MDYSVVLNEISNNQALIVDKFNSIYECVVLAVFILAFISIYIVCRNITKVN